VLPDNEILTHKRFEDIINHVWNSTFDEKSKAVKPELNKAQRERHARIPALQAAWDDYILLWKLTNGD
jgi:hypothetical protein